MSSVVAVDSETHLRQEHYDLLQALRDLQGESVDADYVTATAAGQRLLEIFQTRGGHAWMATAPWHGASPWAQDLRRLDLIDADPGIASFHAPGTPAPTQNDYFLGLTQEGRRVLDARGANQ